MLMGLTALSVIVLDRLSKIWAMAALPSEIIVIPGILQLLYTENTGMAFGLLSGQTLFFAAVTIAALIGAIFVLKKFTLNTFSRLALGLAIGGAIGNLIDRIFMGCVVDMFDLLFMDFAVFNVADMGLTVGIGMLMISILFMPKVWEAKKTCK